MLPRSLKGRLVLAGMAGTLAAGIAASAVIWLQFWPSSPTRAVRAELQEDIDDIVKGMNVASDGALHIELSDDNASMYDAMPRDTAYLVLQDGREAASSIEGPALQQLAMMRSGQSVATVESANGPIHIELAETYISHADHPIAIRAARSERLVMALNDYAAERYLQGSLIAIVMALLTFALITYFTVNRMIQPLQRASRVAASLEPRNLSTRLRSTDLPSEIVPLIEAFNGALVRLEDGFRIQQDFLASAAHELKTPLALLQAEVELGGSANTSSLLRETALMARIVHQLLHLAEASEGGNYDIEPLALQGELESAVGYLQRLADKHAVELTFVSTQAKVVDADRGSLFVLAKNLVENAINHSPEGGRVLVRQDEAGFSVEDEGPGVLENHVPLLFQRFWRATDQDYEGAGLGLTICREICQMHGWKILYEPAVIGARFRVILQPGL
jgi:signal transduction histidine kinase